MGANTTKKYFYLPALGASGQSELDLYNAAQERADSQLPIFPQAYATGTGTVGDPWTGNCLDDAINACPTGGTVYMRAGYYELDVAATADKAISIIGEGIGKTIIKTADTYGITVTADYVTLQGFTIDGTAQTTGDKPVVNIGTVDYCIVRDVEAKEGVSAGIQAFQTNHSLYENLYCHDNGEAEGHNGFHTSPDIDAADTYNTYRNIYCYDNYDQGFDIYGSSTYKANPRYNTYDNIHAWGNGGHGITVYYESNWNMTNCTSVNNGGDGWHIRECSDFNMVDCYGDSNADAYGIRFHTCNNGNIVNCLMTDNGTAGFRTYASTYMTFNNCTAYDDGESDQSYGLYNDTGSNYNKLINCKLSGNLTANIYTDGGTITDAAMVVDGYAAVAGDIQYHDGTNWVRLAKGTAGQVLTMGASVPEWATP